MNKLLSECHDFFKNCSFPYAVGGGWALELFANKKIRPHEDIDISIFDEDRKNLVEFMLNRGWNVYGKPFEKYLKIISSSDDDRVLSDSCVWTIKPDSSLFKLTPKPGEDDVFIREILYHEQLNFDFIEVIFNKQKDGKFLFDPFISQNKDITREIYKAILYNGEIPYVAPEIMLFIISHPAYMDGDYHGKKNKIDFDSVAPLLPKENNDWLINALETAYPDGHKRLEQLKNGQENTNA